MNGIRLVTTATILPLANDGDPVQMARERSAFLIGITATRSRAEFILSRERLSKSALTRIKVNRSATRVPHGKTSKCKNELLYRFSQLCALVSAGNKRD